MTYQPSINCDLSELLDDNSGSVGEGNSLGKIIIYNL